VEHGRQVPVRVAEPREQAGDAVEPEHVRAGRQQGEPVELGLNCRVGGTSVIRQGQAALRACVR
jgi:hypothetical protein